MKRAFMKIFAFCFAVLFCVSFFHVAKWYMDGKKSQNEFAEIEKLLGEKKETDIVQDEKVILEEYLPLYEQNNDFAGWISIEGTVINYPVMKSEEADFYLNHNFEKNYSAYGVPYIQTDCDILSSDNIVIYGHHMDNGSMFADLCKYSDESFYKEHKTVSFNTLYSYGSYEIFAVLKTTGNETGFKYYQFVDAEGEEDFESFVDACTELSLYKTDTSAKYGDRLITLSTCEYSRSNGRIVVVAKLINE